MAKKVLVWEIDGQEVRITSPDKIYFPDAGYTKLEVAEYYRSIAKAALRGVHNRPLVLRRFVKGIAERPFFQKRAPAKRPAWIDTVLLTFPSGRTAEEVVVTDAAQLLWTVNLGCLEMHPHPVRAGDLAHPDELRIDLDPVRGVEWAQVREVGFVTKEVLDELGLHGWPKTSGSRGLHINVRLTPRFNYSEVRRAALAIAREVERRAPKLATSKWWKEERHGVFLDFNQNAKDRTVAAAYSIRPTPDARVSMPITWEELERADPAAYTLKTVPALVAEHGGRHEGIDEAVCELDQVLELVAEHEEAGVGDAPWPPQFPVRARESVRTLPGGTKKAPGRRKSKMPLLIIAKAAKEADALAELERWKLRFPEAAKYLEPADVLVDVMRGRSSTWTRIRLNLRHVPEALRPEQEPHLMGSERGPAL